MKYFFRLCLTLTVAAVFFACSHRVYPSAGTVSASETDWMERPDGFHDRYTLEEAVVLSRHNIRSPLSGKGSVLSRITPHEWFEWTSAPGELSRKGGVLETQMGQFFRQWLISEGLMTENERPAEGQMRFYANSMQRTIATAQYFSSGMLPLANVEVERHCAVGTMDPVFNPQVTRDDPAFRERAMAQIRAMGGEAGLGGVGARMAADYAVLESVLDLRNSPAARNDTTAIPLGDLAVRLDPLKEPSMTGGLKMANSASDALVLQYYEEPDLQRAAFGHRIGREDWERIAAIKDWYGDVLFTAPAVAANVARPLLQTILSELNKDGRKFAFLCGHDSNIASVLAALGNEDYEAPRAIERKTPIGSKLVFCKWRGHDGREYADIRLVYASDTQLRDMPMLSLQQPPVSLPIRLKGLNPNGDGLYPLPDLEKRFQEAISAEPPTVAPANKAEKVVAALHDPASKYVVVVSHRGDWRNYPENSLPAIESVIRMGVDMVEIDLRLTRDSVLVLCHDSTLDRTTTGRGRISDFTYEELLAFNLKRGHGVAIPGLKIPTFRQALELCKDRITINVDKGYEYYDLVLALTEELGVTDQILIKGKRPVGEVRTKLSEHPHNLMYMPIASVGNAKEMSVFDGYIQAKPAQMAYEICFGTLDDNVRATVRTLLDSGSKLWVNTIWASLCGGYDDDAAFDAADPDAIYGPILDLGTSIIQTDRPEFLIRYLEKKGRR